MRNLYLVRTTERSSEVSIFQRDGMKDVISGMHAWHSIRGVSQSRVFAMMMNLQNCASHECSDVCPVVMRLVDPHCRG